MTAGNDDADGAAGGGNMFAPKVFSRMLEQARYAPARTQPRPPPSPRPQHGVPTTRTETRTHVSFRSPSSNTGGSLRRTAGRPCITSRTSRTHRSSHASGSKASSCGPTASTTATGDDASNGSRSTMAPDLRCASQRRRRATAPRRRTRSHDARRGSGTTSRASGSSRRRTIRSGGGAGRTTVGHRARIKVEKTAEQCDGTRSSRRGCMT